MIAPASLARWRRGLRLDAADTPLGAIRRYPTSKQAQGLSRVLYWDRHILVHNKESGRDCQNYGIESAGSERFHLPGLPYQVHRLDKNTTGALLLARTSQRAKELSRDFRQHNIHKTYHALVLNLDDQLKIVDNGEVTMWHHLDAENRPRLVPAGTDGAREAKTAWRVLGLSGYNQGALLELNPTTGFKHQLRLTCAHRLDKPILGDSLHGRFESVAKRGHAFVRDDEAPNLQMQGFGGMFLHASRISVTRFRRTGPSKRLQLTIGAPLPPNWIELCNFLGIALPPELIEGGVSVDGERVADGRVPELDGEWVW
ncbi:pseudouridine synthase [Peniophora sp. CONT]|nr:pseudouridine synthase [Peniophora sp. CONT]